MPVADPVIPSSNWAEEDDDLDDTAAPTLTETIKDNIKTQVEYRTNKEGKKVKVVRQYKIEKRHVSKFIARRKTWPKFGLSSMDGPGPQAATTVISDEITMQFITSREDADRQDEEPLSKLKGSKAFTMRCRVCKHDHWTHHCPHKDALQPKDALKEESKSKNMAQSDEKLGTRGLGDAGSKKYIPPSKREGASKTGESMMLQKEDQPTIRISNLSEATTDVDLQELCKPFGKVGRIFLGKNRQTGESRGFAYVTFYRKEDALKAINALNGHGYDHLILKAEWSVTSKK